MNDRSDEAQVKVAFVRNGGKTMKLFVSVLCTNARNAKRAVVNVLSCNTENSMETYIPGGFSSMFFSIRMDNCFVTSHNKSFDVWQIGASSCNSNTLTNQMQQFYKFIT